MALIGNKNDLFAQEDVDEEEARQLAKEYNAEFKTVSACTGDGIDELFTSLVKIYESKPKKINESGEECLENTASFELRRKKKKKATCCS